MCDIIKSVYRYIHDPLPLLRAHARKYRIIMDTSIVHKHLNRCLFYKWSKRIYHCIMVSDIKTQDLRATTISDNFIGQYVCGFDIMISVDQYVVTIGRQSATNGSTYAAATTSDERMFHMDIPKCVSALSLTAARPLSSICPAACSVNSYKILSPLP